MSLIAISMTISFTQNLYTHIIWGFLMILFSWVLYELYIFWVSIVEWFSMLKYFQNYFRKPLPTPLSVVGWATMPCMLLIENPFKYVHEMGGRKYELYTWSYYVFNWYHWILSIGITIDIFFCILIYIFIYVCLHFK